MALMVFSNGTTAQTNYSEMSGDINISGSSTVFPVMQAVQQRWQELAPSVTMEIASVGSGGGFDRLAQGTTDLAPMSRAPKQDELDSVDFTVNVTKIGLDALSIIVNDANPINDANFTTIQAIFNGTYSTWDQAFPHADFSSFSSKDIVVYQRDENSGTHDYFDEEFLQGNLPAADAQYNAQADLNTAVSQTQNSIGYSGLAYVDSTVKALDFQGADQSAPVTPSIASAADGSYALARPLFLVFNQDESNSLRDAIVNYVLTPEGQYLVRDVGYVPIADDVATTLTPVAGGSSAPLPVLPIIASITFVGLLVRKRRD